MVDTFIDIGDWLQKQLQEFIGPENIGEFVKLIKAFKELMNTLDRLLDGIILFLIILLILLVVFSVVWCYILALQKRRNLAQWVLLGIVFNVFAVITLALLPPLTKQTKDESKGVSNKSTNKPPSKKKKKASRIDRKDSNSK